MRKEITFTVNSQRFDENYQPATHTRITTNFANLARGSRRQDNLRKALQMIDNRFNSLAFWDNSKGDRYRLELDIISVDMNLEVAGRGAAFPLLEMLQTHIIDQQTGARTDGMVGNNFSSFVRDYDFSILLPEHNRCQSSFSVPDDFGDLHGQLFKHFLKSSAYRAHFKKLPVICISSSSSKIYHRTENRHPILGVEYRQDQDSSTDLYFEKMGLKVRYFMPPNSVAPLAFYAVGDLLGDYTNLELISTISTMETFQKIYRPEIYNANSAAGQHYQPSLTNQDYSLTQIVYDREERSQLAVQQGKFAEEAFIKPYQRVLDQWVKGHALS